MRILFTGATGVIGRRAVPRLVDAGHEVVANVRDDRGREWARSVGAVGVTVDLFDPSAVADAVADADAIVHFATAIPRQEKMTRREAWATNDRLRTEATRVLVDAAIAGGVQVFVQESITFFYADGGDRWLDEDSAVEPVWDVLESALDAEREVARFSAAGGRGVILRMARLYGPGRTSEELIGAVSARKLPIVGSGKNLVSHLHVDDAASALVAGLDAPDGTYNVGDDEPVRSRESLGGLASLLGAEPPRRIPRSVARIGAGRASRLLSTSHRISNRRFREATGWAPGYRSVSEGWPAVVATIDDPAHGASEPR